MGLFAAADHVADSVCVLRSGRLVCLCLSGCVCEMAGCVFLVGVSVLLRIS
uniref:Uncharacterized protein n=1 Tax=Arundo donax TaxID=35708 RepID=A0A0A9AQ90_ARUDO